MKPLALAAALAAIGSSRAHAHDHMDMQADAGSNDFAATVSLVAASYDTMTFSGDYEGVLPRLTWTHGRFSLAAMASAYRLYENGIDNVGIGDVMASGSLVLYTDGAFAAGVMAMVSAPTGDEYLGFGMGHAMAMPSAFASWTVPGITLSGAFGYSRALISFAHLGTHDHGVWPLVDPMNMSELSWSGAGDHAFTRDLRVGARMSGGIPVGHVVGHERVIGSLRVAFGHGRVETAAEVQVGLVGDPFNVRGVVETALRF